MLKSAVTKFPCPLPDGAVSFLYLPIFPILFFLPFHQTAFRVRPDRHKAECWRPSDETTKQNKQGLLP